MIWKITRFGLMVWTSFWVSHLQVEWDAKAADDCACAELNCSPCENQAGLTFFTEKCGGGLKVKSCARPTCVAKDPMPPECLAVNREQLKRELAATTDLAASKGKTELLRGELAGEVIAIVGASELVMPNQEVAALSVKTPVYEHDQIVTGPSGRVQVRLKSSDVITINPGSRLEVSTLQYQNAEKKKQTLLKLIKGKVRAQVKEKYQDAENSYFRVETKGVVAGVRGTDFVVTHSESDLSTQVETLTGEVQMVADQSVAKVPKGHYARFVVNDVSSSMLSAQDIDEFVARGQLSPVYEMSPDQIRTVQDTTRIEPYLAAPKQRDTASTPDANLICASPSAAFNYCAWECLNNPKSEKTCRTDLVEVSCRRRRCNANGEWAEEVRLPASYSHQCDPVAAKVAPCDY